MRLELAEFELYGALSSSCDECGLLPTGSQIDPTSATASSSENSFKTADKAIDDNFGTRWSSAFQNNQWIYFNLGGTFVVDRVVLHWETATSADYDIQVSHTGLSNSWTTIFTRQDAALGPRTDDFSGLSGTGSFLRIFSRSRNTQYGVSLYEVEIYGTPECPPLIDAAERCDGDHCCPLGVIPKSMDGAPFGCVIQESPECIVGSTGDDWIVSPPDASSQVFYALGGPGNDSLRATDRPAFLAGGAGDDTLCGGTSPGSELYGGPGDDVITALTGNNIASPGPGLDAVQFGDGDDTLVISDECEVVSGEVFDFGGGNNLLYSPFTPFELGVRGVLVLGTYTHVPYANPCGAECAVGRPICDVGTACAYNPATGETSCVDAEPRIPGQVVSVIPATPWASAPEDVRNALMAYFNSTMLLGSEGTLIWRANIEALRTLQRETLNSVANAALAELSLQPAPYWKRMQVEILALLGDPDLIPLFFTIADNLRPAECLQPQHHMSESCFQELVARNEAVRGLRIIGQRGSEEARQALLSLLGTPDVPIQEAAVIALRSLIVSQSDYDAIVNALPPDRQFLATIGLRHQAFPTPPGPAL